MVPEIDPTEYTVSALEAAIEDVRDPDALAAMLEAERAGEDRTTAVEAIEDRLRAVDAESGAGPANGPDETPGPAGDEGGMRTTLQEVLLYPWDGGTAGLTLVIGGILTLLSPLLVPAVIVLGYGLRVVDAELDGREGPPAFDDLGPTFVGGLKGAIVLLVYTALPLAVGAGIVSAVADAVGVRLGGPLPAVTGTAGAVGFLLVLSLAGLAVVVWYLAPAALVHVARTRRLPAAFDRDAVWRLATADVYGSAWLLALAVFAAAAVVLAVLYAAAVGVIVSGFVTFYAFVAMAYLFAQAAEAAGFDREVQDGGGEVEG